MLKTQSIYFRFSFLLSITALSITLTSVGAFAAPITYNLFDDFGTATLTGTITTDGSIGAIGNGKYF